MTTKDNDCRPEFEAWLASCGRNPLMWNTSDAMLAAWAAATRAALATQPASGEPVYQWHDETAWQECHSKREYLHAKDNGIRVRILWTAPPAAAHGDEAVRKDAERLDFILTKARKVVVDCISSGRFDVYVEEGIMGDVAYPGVRREFTPNVGSAQELAVMREAIDAAMRAQGDDRLLFTDAIMPGGMTET